MEEANFVKNAHQLHGMFGALVMEEAGATFHNIRNGETKQEMSSNIMNVNIQISA